MGGLLEIMTQRRRGDQHILAQTLARKKALSLP